jgi:hypothetical protein
MQIKRSGRETVGDSHCQPNFSPAKKCAARCRGIALALAPQRILKLGAKR